jgi:hypothetical protein
MATSPKKDRGDIIDPAKALQEPKDGFSILSAPAQCIVKLIEERSRLYLRDGILAEDGAAQ